VNEEESSDFTYSPYVEFEQNLNKITDLLNNESKDNNNNVLKTKPTFVDSANEALKLLRSGMRNRKIGETGCNQTSSRSHVIFSITITKDNKETRGFISKSILCFLVLGGTERVNESHPTPLQLKEGSYINTSLSHLKTVIEALSKSLPHIPYKNDQLTEYLQDIFEGNTEINMIACISSSNGKSNRIRATLDYVNGMKKMKPLVKKGNVAGKIQMHTTPKKEQTLNPGNNGENQNETNGNLLQRFEGLEKQVKELQLILETSKVVQNKAPRMVKIHKNIVPKPMEEPSEFPKIPYLERKILVDVARIMVLCEWLLFYRNAAVYKSLQEGLCRKDGYWTCAQECPKNFRKKSIAS
jgi:hypothetical protein